MSKTLVITVAVVHTPWDETNLNTEANLRSPEEAAQAAMNEVCGRILENIPKDNACSLVVGHQEIDDIV